MAPYDGEKRRRIMNRSMALGHCVCDPRKPCPCPELREHDVCECAGERRPVPPGTTRLTAWVRGAGCASKIAKADLDAILTGLPGLDDPRVLLGSAAGDDAGVILLREDDTDALVLTVDVFAPAADDPFLCGRIAAANALSDVYAMGGEPVAALSVVGFPTDDLPHDIMRTMLEGGLATMAEAGVPVVGGHSIRDADVKMGFAVVGRVARDGFLSHAGAQAGDALVLTKPVGAGLLSFAAQIGRTPEAGLAAAQASMCMLNRVVGACLRSFGAHAATDVTGFGLLPHLVGILSKSGVGAVVDFDSIPLFPGVPELARADVLPGAVERNREAVDAARIEWEGMTPAQEAVLFSPETSGGLLVALPAEGASRFVGHLHSEGIDAACIIGRIDTSCPAGHVRVGTTRASAWTPMPLPPVSTAQPTALDACPEGASLLSEATSPSTGDSAPKGCCCGTGHDEDFSSQPGSTSAVPVAHGVDAPRSRSEGRTVHASAATGEGVSTGTGGGAGEVDPLKAFGGYMAEVMRPGALGGKTKSLMALALSVAMRCGPCIGIHLRGARKAGASEGEIGEAVAEGIAFGGAAAAMGYREAVAALEA